MATTFNPYNSVLLSAASGLYVPFNTSDLRINLYTAFTFNPAHTTKTQAETGATQVATGNGYTQNSKVVANPAFISYATSGLAFKSDAIIWYPGTGETLTARYGLLYFNGLQDKPPLALIDFGQSTSVQAPQPFIIAPPADGWATANWQ